MKLFQSTQIFISGFVATILMIGCSPNSDALTSRRALVLGNDSYPGNALRNARNDARSVANALEALNYATTLVLDTDRLHMSGAINQFAASLNPGDTAFVYYAGHGLQVDGENFLVPVDFQVSDAADAKFQGYSLSLLLKKVIEHGATTQVMILDACRDNPFQFTRGLRNGWAPAATSAGSFLAFGTAPGSTAGDAPNDDHGVFTKSLLRYISDPELDIEQMFQKVRKDVIISSGGQQVPWTASSLVGSFHIVPESDLSSPALEVPAQGGNNILLQSNRSLGIALGPEYPIERAEDVVELVSQARGLLRSSLWGDAIRVLEAALSIDPRCAVALRLLGVALHMAGRGTEADEAFGRAITVDPNEATAYAYRCLASADRPFVLRSSQNCLEALRLKNDLAVAHLGLAVNLIASAQNSQAAREINQVIALDPREPGGFLLQAAMYEAEGRVEEAAVSYSKATELSIALLP